MHRRLINPDLRGHEYHDDSNATAIAGNIEEKREELRWEKLDEIDAKYMMAVRAIITNYERDYKWTLENIASTLLQTLKFNTPNNLLEHEKAKNNLRVAWIKARQIRRTVEVLKQLFWIMQNKDRHVLPTNRRYHRDYWA
jgi:hypothetical protein